MRNILGYRGSVPRLQAVRQREADAAWLVITRDVKELIRKGELKPLIWLGPKIPELAGVPDLKDVMLHTEEGKAFGKLVLRRNQP